MWGTAILWGNFAQEFEKALFREDELEKVSSRHLLTKEFSLSKSPALTAPDFSPAWPPWQRALVEYTAMWPEAVVPQKRSLWGRADLEGDL